MPKVIDTDSLFRATTQLFAERGYYATTTLEIAKRAGVNEVTLFRRYTSKANLIGAALTHCLSTSPFGQLTLTDDVQTDLVAIVAAYQATFKDFGGAVMTMMIEIPRHTELREATSALLPNLQAAAGIISAHQERGAIGPGDPLQKLIQLIAPLMMAGLWGRSGAKVEAPVFDPTQVVGLFLDGHRSA
jgi:AcrR family transcriptional regulator